MLITNSHNSNLVNVLRSYQIKQITLITEFHSTDGQNTLRGYKRKETS